MKMVKIKCMQFQIIYKINILNRRAHEVGSRYGRDRLGSSLDEEVVRGVEVNKIKI